MRRRREAAEVPAVLAAEVAEVSQDLQWPVRQRQREHPFRDMRSAGHGYGMRQENGRFRMAAAPIQMSGLQS